MIWAGVNSGDYMGGVASAGVNSGDYIGGGVLELAAAAEVR
jgi:hypothetical protein